jgi:uncharacterized protein YraI
VLLHASGKCLVITAVASLTLAAPPILGAAVAQYYYPAPAGEVGVYRDYYAPPAGEVEVYRAPSDVVPDTVNVYPPARGAVGVSPADHASTESAPAHQASATDVPAQPASGTTTPISAVSMRAGPGTGNPVVGTLHHGMPLQILATANHGWIEVQSSAGTGWVYGSYLASGTNVSASMPAPADTNAPAPIPVSTSGDNQPAAGTQPTPTRRNPAAPEITSP